jgi:exopolysaccharide biosynthesis polyprenyl glycosylphosphotransferase
MKPLDTRSWITLLKLFDLGGMIAAFLLAAFVPYETLGAVSFSEFLGMRVKVQNFAMFVGFMGAWHCVLSYFRLYQPDRALRAGQAEALDVTKATLCGAVGIWIIAALINIEIMTAPSLLVFWATACALSMLSRMGLRFALRGSGAATTLTHLVIVGTNTRAVALAKKIESNLELGYRLVGFVDDQWYGETQFHQAGYNVVSDFDGFQSFLKDHVVDEVIICTPIKSFYDRSSRIVTQCEQQGITTRFASDLFKPTIGRSRVEQVNENSLVTIDTGGMRGPAVIVKRAIDFVVSAVLLLLLTPLFLAIALSIKVTSPGPVFFIQERIGRNKRRFRLYKFRTMVPDAEKRLGELEKQNEVSGPVFKIKHDPRVTAIGALLRKTSLDELPQLINVIKGDMSLVGPRPLPVRDYRGFTEDWHRRRFSVRPGITCLWQVRGRSAIPFEKWMELDMQYIDQWSLLLDMKILVKTIPAVLKGSGAH